MVILAGKLLVRRGWKAEFTLVKVQRRIKGSWVGHLGQRGAKVRIVTGLDCKDGAGNCQIVGIRDVGCGAQIGRDAHAFQNRCKSHE